MDQRKTLHNIMTYVSCFSYDHSTTQVILRLIKKQPQKTTAARWQQQRANHWNSMNGKLIKSIHHIVVSSLKYSDSP